MDQYMTLPTSPNNGITELSPNQRRARKKMYRERKKNMFKKAEELSILCGTDVAVILYQPADESTTTAQPAAEIWPKDPTEVKRIIRRYKAKTASILASFPSACPREMEDKNTSTPSSSSSSSSPPPTPSPSPSPSPTPTPSPSPNRREKRKYINLELSLSSFYDSDKRILKEDKGKKKLRADDDENKSSEEAMGMPYEFHTRWNATGKGVLCNDLDEMRIGYEDHEAKLASLEAKRDAITKRIALLEATSFPLYHFN